MPRTPRHDWFLESWMLAAGLDQADMIRKAKWSKRKASMLFNGEQRYNRDSLNEAAEVLGIEPWELLMHPAEADEIRALRAAVRQQAVRLVAERQQDWRGPEPPEKLGTYIPS